MCVPSLWGSSAGYRGTSTLQATQAGSNDATGERADSTHQQGRGWREVRKGSPSLQLPEVWWLSAYSDRERDGLHTLHMNTHKPHGADFALCKVFLVNPFYKNILTSAACVIFATSW